jgi:hypothetical protein
MKARVVPGTGLPPLTYAALVALSVVLFLFWGGPLWRATASTSHVMRFVVSYAAVIPLAVLALRLYRRLTLSNVAATTGTAWALKLVITSVLYIAIARGTSAKLVAVQAPSAPTLAATRAVDEYRAAPAGFAAGDIRGTVTQGGAPVAFAVVAIDQPRAGRAQAAPGTADLVITRARYAEPLYVAHSTDEVRVASRDGVLHTIHLRELGKSVENRPLPPGAAPSVLPPLAVGLYHLACDNHLGESTWLLVVDHPYVTRTDAAGRFAFAGAPAGDARLAALAPAGGGLARASVSVHVLPAAATEVAIELTTNPSTPGELRN